MGLAGRKQKQRIPADPRNLSWADDASRFGRSYLAKFGWDASQGLGSSGDGMRTHLKVQQKLDMMGIGAQHQRDPNGIAWKQNKEFEALLKRLNGKCDDSITGNVGNQEKREHGTEMSRAFAWDGTGQVERIPQAENELPVTTKKRKYESGDGPEPGGNAQKKQKRDKARKSTTISDRSATPSATNSNTTSDTEPSPTPCSLGPGGPGSIPIFKPKPRPMAHRARIRAAKCITDKSASAISEVLGIAPASASHEVPALQPSSTPTEPTFLPLGILKTSAKSVADYFKEKLVARPLHSSSASSSGLPTPVAGPEPSSSPDWDEAPRRGIGSRAPFLTPVDPEADCRDIALCADALTGKQQRKAGKQKLCATEGISIDTKSARQGDEAGSSKERGGSKRREREFESPRGDNHHDIPTKDIDNHDAQNASTGEAKVKKHKKKRS